MLIQELMNCWQKKSDLSLTLIQLKKIKKFLTPQSVFATHKGKPQGRVGLGNDECAFYKEKGHWKTQWRKLLLKSNTKNFTIPTSNVVVVPPSTFGSIYIYPFETTSQISNLCKAAPKDP